MAELETGSLYTESSKPSWRERKNWRFLAMTVANALHLFNLQISKSVQTKDTVTTAKDAMSQSMGSVVVPTLVRTR